MIFSGRFLFVAIAVVLGSNLFAGNDLRFFQRHYLQRGNYKDIPLADEDVGTLKLYAAGGEYEPVQFLVRSASPVKNLSLVLEDDFKSTDSRILKNEAEIRIVVDQKHWLDSRRFERLPYLLMKKKSFELKPDQTERIWLDVHVPEYARPGKYLANIQVLADGNILKKIPVELTVWPFALKTVAPDKMAYFMYFGMLLPEWMHNKEYLERVFKDMKEHGMNSVSAYLAPSNEKGTDILNSLQPAAVNPNSAFSVNQYLDAMKDSGIMREGGKFIWLGAATAAPCVIAEVCRVVEKNKMEILFYGIDEPETEDRQKAQRNITGKLKKEFPDKKIVTAIGEKGINAVGECLDAWLVEAIDMNRKNIEKAAAMKKGLYSYECRLSPVDPLNSRYYCGFMVWKSGAKGAAYWYYGGHIGAFTDRFGIAIRDWREYNPDCQYKFDYVFCTPDELIPSIGWNGGVREGIDDYRYIITLEEWIEKAEKAGKTELAQGGRALLSELGSRINPENYRKAFDEVMACKESGRGGEIGTNYYRPAPEPCMKVSDYDEFRRKIALEIVKISSVLGEQ